MSNTVSGSRLAKLGFVSFALVLAVATGAVVMEGPARAAKPDPVDAQGRKLFKDWSCGTCHVLKDAGGRGTIGPKLDGAKLTKAFVSGRITKGQGAMPGFADTISKKDIDILSTYIVAQSKK